MTVSPATGRGWNGSGRGAWSWPCLPAMTSPVLTGIPGIVFGCVIQADGVEELAGDLLAAVQDCLDGGTADEMGQAADHPAGAPVQVLVQPGQGSRLVAVQPQRVLDGGD